MFSQRADSYDRNETIRKTRGIPQQGQKGIPQKKQEGETHEPTRLTGQTLRKRRVLATAAGQNPRNSHKSQRGQEGPAKTTRPLASVAGQVSRRRATKQGVRKTKRELQYRYGAQEKRSAEASAGLFKKIIHYASEVSHSTIQLFKNGLESGASALTIRNLASPSAVLQTSVRKRTPGRTGEVKRHLKRVIALG